MLKASLCSKNFSNDEHLGFLVCATGLPGLRFLVVTSHSYWIWIGLWGLCLMWRLTERGAVGIECVVSALVVKNG